jgi:hypothetical protein
MAKTAPEIFQPQAQQTLPSENSIPQSIAPRYPHWPTSKPGPRSTPPLAGTHPINSARPEQVEVISEQQTGDSAWDSMINVSTANPGNVDQPKNAQQVLGKRKKRL